MFRDAREARAFLAVTERRTRESLQAAFHGVISDRRAFAADVVLTAMGVLAEEVTVQ